jgi:hypothetical protein
MIARHEYKDCSFDISIAKKLQVWNSYGAFIKAGQGTV